MGHRAVQHGLGAVQLGARSTQSVQSHPRVASASCKDAERWGAR